jgi:hypothetical protein
VALGDVQGLAAGSRAGIQYPHAGLRIAAAVRRAARPGPARTPRRNRTRQGLHRGGVSSTTASAFQSTAWHRVQCAPGTQEIVDREPGPGRPAATWADAGCWPPAWTRAAVAPGRRSASTSQRRSACRCGQSHGPRWLTTRRVAPRICADTALTMPLARPSRDRCGWRPRKVDLRLGGAARISRPGGPRSQQPRASATSRRTDGSTGA